MSESLFDKVVGFQACSLIKKRLEHSEYCEIFKNMYFEKHLPTNGSVNSRVTIFQESLALPFKQNDLISGICNLDKLV